MKNFFLPQFFSPNASRVLAKHCSRKDLQEDDKVIFELYHHSGIVEYQILPDNYLIFIPKHVLNNCKFGKIQNRESAKKILHITVSQNDFLKMITQLGGSVRRRTKTTPTLRDLGL